MILMTCFSLLQPKTIFSSIPSSPTLTQCVANYYVRAAHEFNTDLTWKDKLIVMERRVLTDPEIPDWKSSTKTFQKLTIAPIQIGIEDIRDSPQINFADPVPGGTLPSRYPDIVQEEILFLIYPELFITPILIPIIQTNEAVIVKGVTRTNKYTGYKGAFRYDGDFTQDKNDCTIIHIDALPGAGSVEKHLLRELNKAYIGFSADLDGKPIATGHWGCGAFGGNHMLKSIIQLIAAAEAERDLVYVFFKTPLAGFADVHALLVEGKITVGALYQSLVVQFAEKKYDHDFYAEISKQFGSPGTTESS